MVFRFALERYRAVVARSPFVGFGLPFVTFTVLGSFALSQFTALRYEMKDRRVSKVSEREVRTWKGKERYFDMQAEYKRMQQQWDQKWEQRRIDRPPE